MTQSVTSNDIADRNERFIRRSISASWWLFFLIEIWPIEADILFGFARSGQLVSYIATKLLFVVLILAPILFTVAMGWGQPNQLISRRPICLLLLLMALVSVRDIWVVTSILART